MSRILKRSLIVSVCVLLVTFSLPTLAANINSSAQPTQGPCGDVRVSGKLHVDPQNPAQMVEVIINEDCSIVVRDPVTVKAGTPEYAALTSNLDVDSYESKEVSADTNTPIVGQSGVGGTAALTNTTKTCNSYQRVEDYVDITLTQVLTKHTWTYDGATVLTSSASVIASYLKDGWKITDGPYGQLYPSLPNPYRNAVGWASFAYGNNNGFPHTHYVGAMVFGDGHCEGSYDFTGELCYLGSFPCRLQQGLWIE